MRGSTLLLALLVISLISAYFIFDVGQYVSLEFLQSKHQVLLDYAAKNPKLSIAFYFALYVTAAIFALPAIWILTVSAGAIFGLTTGVILVSFASVVGATLAFLISRFIFRRVVQKRFASQLKTINAGFEKEGAFYLFTMRLIPIFPFCLINFLMGLTNIKTSLFYLVSQAGMLPSSVVFVYAGTQLAQIKTPKDIFSPTMVFAFVLLGIFPITTKKLIEFYKHRKLSGR